MTDFKELVLGNAGKKKTPNPLKLKTGKGRKKKGKWSDTRPLDAQGRAYPNSSPFDLSDMFWK
jgi:hypothetical protein